MFLQIKINISYGCTGQNLVVITNSDIVALTEHGLRRYLIVCYRKKRKIMNCFLFSIWYVSKKGKYQNGSVSSALRGRVYSVPLNSGPVLCIEIEFVDRSRLEKIIGL